MNITVSQAQGRVPVTVFHVEGNVDTTTYEQLQTQVRKAIDAGAHDVVLDLTAVPYVSSAGIRAINNIFKWLRTDAPAESDAVMRQGVRDGTYKSPHLKLVNLTPRVKDVLTMAGVDMFIEIHADLDSAVAAF